MTADCSPESADSPMLEFRNVTKTFGAGPAQVTALSDVDLSIARGEIVAVMGPSGCGKSTLLHLAGALERATSGEVLVDGRDVGGLGLVAESELRRRTIGFVFQRLNLIASLSAVENVMMPLELDGVSSRTARDEALERLATVGLADRATLYPDSLSGGERQRVAIARALTGDRQLILADEPTGALDVQRGDEIIALLADLPARTGSTVVLVTHEPRFASCADRVVFLRDGRVVDITAASDDVSLPSVGVLR